MTLFSTAEGLVLLGLFAATMFGVTEWRRRSRITKTSYLVADRQVGWRPAAFSIAATWIWAPALFVAAQQGYTNGWVGVFWFTVPNVACLVVFAFFAARIRRKYPEGFTLSGYVRDRLSSRAHKAYLVAFGLLAVCSFAVQLLAGGLIVATLTGLPFLLVTLILTGTVVAYSLRSGLGASIRTDYAQMVIIAVVGLVLAPWVVLEAGLGTVAAGLTGVEGNMTSLITGPGAGVFWSFGLATSIGLLSGPFGDQSFWQRAWAVKERDVKKAFVAGAAIFAVVPLTMSLLGFAAAGSGVLVDNPQLTNLQAILQWLPAWTVIPFLWFILSGLTSTLDSNLCSVASLAGHDLTRADHNVVRNARWAMVLLAVVATALANAPGLLIVQLFVFYGTLRASTLLPTVLMLSWRKAIHEAGVFWGVVAALAVGVPLAAYGNILGGGPAFIVGGALATLALSGGVTVAVSLIKQPEAEYLDRFGPGYVTQEV